MSSAAVTLQRCIVSVSVWFYELIWRWPITLRMTHSFQTKMKGEEESRTELFRCISGRLHARMFCLLWSQIHSQMGADWTPDDLLWCGKIVCFGAKRRGRGKEKRTGALGTRCPTKVNAVLVGCHHSGAVDSQATGRRTEKSVPQICLLLCCIAIPANNNYHYRLTKEN